MKSASQEIWRRLLAFCLAAMLLGMPLSATWSIVVVNLKTREVCVASATCIEGDDLELWVPVIVPDIGVAAAQSFVEASAVNRKLIREQMVLGLAPEQILALVEAQDNSYQRRQFGIVDLQGRAVTFTGNQAGGWAGGLVGQDGDLVYAIQGNVLTGQPVVLEAEQALLNSQGDLASRVMVAMEAARDMGGDGRCSCSIARPESCGSPPASFTHSATIAFMIVARPGDVKGVCNGSVGCAAGDYYMDLNIAGTTLNDPDPVTLLRAEYDAWRLTMQGRPDGVHSRWYADAEQVAAGSGEIVNLYLDLFDIDAQPLVQGGAAITIAHESSSAKSATLQNVIDNGDGTYDLQLLAGDDPGQDRIRILVDDGIRKVRVWPPVTLLHTPPVAAPFNDLAAIEGISSVHPTSQAQLLEDQLTAYWLADRNGQGFELWKAVRTTPADPFGVPQAVDVPQLGFVSWTDFWISSNELELIVSGTEIATGLRHLYRAERADVADPFTEPELVFELDSDTGDEQPWVSGNELEMVYCSNRGGTGGIWRAKRRREDAFWFEPELLLADPAGSQLSHPMLIDGGTRLLFSLKSPGNPARVHYAQLDGTGEYLPKGPYPGAIHPPLADISVSGTGNNDQELWLNRKQGQSYQAVAARRTDAALSASASSVSVTHGGVVDLWLDAGSPWANTTYVLAASAHASTTPGTPWLDAILPLQFDWLTRRSLQRPNQKPFEGFLGVLDSNGQAQARVIVTAGHAIDPALLDRDYPLAFLAVNGQNSFASNAIRLRLLP